MESWLDIVMSGLHNEGEKFQLSSGPFYQKYQYINNITHTCVVPSYAFVYIFGLQD